MRLAGRYEKGDMEQAILTIQMGKGLMPAYEQQIDRHESKRILIWLNALDPIEGAPLPEPEAPEEDSEEAEGDTVKKESSEAASSVEADEPKVDSPESKALEPAAEQEQQ